MTNQYRLPELIFRISKKLVSGCSLISFCLENILIQYSSITCISELCYKILNIRGSSFNKDFSFRIFGILFLKYFSGVLQKKLNTHLVFHENISKKLKTKLSFLNSFFINSIDYFQLENRTAQMNFALSFTAKSYSTLSCLVNVNPLTAQCVIF